MLIDGLHKAPLTTSGRSLPHPHAPLSSLRTRFFRPCLGGAQAVAYRNVAWVSRNGFSPVDYFFCSGEGGSCPAFDAGESLAGNDSLEASSRGASVKSAGWGSGV